MHELGQSNRREHCPLIACHCNDLFEHLRDIVASAFSGDDDAGVEDQSHAGGLSGSLRLLMISSRSRPKSPSSVTVEPCASARAIDSESRRPGCGPAERSTATGRMPFSMTTS